MALVFLWPLAGMAEEEGYYSESFARLSFVKGDVYVERANELGTEQGIVNLALVEGDKLITRAGRAEVNFRGRNYLRLDNSTEVEFSAMPREGDDRVRLHLLAGSVYLRISHLREEKTFEVHTADASFYVLEEGLYRLDMRMGGETVLSVLEGSMEAAGEEGSRLVGSRESLLASTGHLGTQTALSSRRDDFDHWNQDRDSLLRQYASRRYLPDELGEYEGELESNGYWVYERPYGYVWVPYIVYPDWRPYYYGRWVWYPICGWTWVSYEPWGWCVYHYGRWHWRLGLGWYWIPTRYWGPAWVHWYWDYDYIGWCPLSWYNRPVVIVNNYFYDRYHHHYYPAHSRALTVIHRSQLQSPDVSRVALSHIEASRLGQITLQTRQPDIKPTALRSPFSRPSASSELVAPQIRPTNKSLTPSSRPPAGSSVEGSLAGKNRLSPSAGRWEPSLRTGEKQAERRRQISGYLSTRRESNPAIRPFSPSSGAPSPSLRRIRSDAQPLGKSSDSPRTRGVASYSSSRSISSPVFSSRARPSSVTRETPRVFTPNPTLGRPKDYSPNVTSRGNSWSDRRSFSSSFSAPKSIFSAPRSFSSAPSLGMPSTASRSSPSFSSSPSRSFAPSRSASTPRSSSSAPGRVSKRNN